MRITGSTPFNTPTMLIIYTAASTWGCLTVPTGYAVAGWAGATAVLALVSVFIFCTIVTSCEIAKALSQAQHRSTAVEIDTTQDSSAIPAVQALDAKLDAICKHLGVKAAS